MTNNNFDDELTAAAPWYVNGTLTKSEQREFELHAFHSDTLRAELATLARLKQDIAASVERSSAQFSEERSLTKVLGMIRACDEGKLSLIPGSKRNVSPWYRAAFAAAATVLVAQALVFMSDTASPVSVSPNRLLSLGASTGSHALPQLQITFQAYAQEAEIRRLLSSVGAEIIGGPGALGVYTVSVPQEKFAATI